MSENEKTSVECRHDLFFFSISNNTSKPISRRVTTASEDEINKLRHL
jgi:hypothetical protein